MPWNHRRRVSNKMTSLSSSAKCRKHCRKQNGELVRVMFAIALHKSDVIFCVHFSCILLFLAQFENAHKYRWICEDDVHKSSNSVQAYVWLQRPPRPAWFLSVWLLIYLPPLVKSKCVISNAANRPSLQQTWTHKDSGELRHTHTCTPTHTSGESQRRLYQPPAVALV